MDQTDLQVVTYTDIMAPDTLTDYWVSWEDHVIEFGVGRARDQQYTVISQSDSTYTVTSVGLAVDQTYDVDWQMFTENGQQAYFLFSSSVQVLFIIINTFRLPVVHVMLVNLVKLSFFTLHPTEPSKYRRRFETFFVFYFT